MELPGKPFEGHEGFDTTLDTVGEVRTALRILVTRSTAIIAQIYESAEEIRENFGRHVPQMMGDPCDWLPGGAEMRLAEGRTRVCLHLLSEASALDRIEEPSERASAWSRWLWMVRESWDVLESVKLLGDKDTLKQLRIHLISNE